MSDVLEKIGPYQVLRRIGAGGMGEVFLAYDERLDRHVAIKRIRPDKSAAPERRERFRREASMAARLNHPAIVQVYDVLTEGDADFIVMEYVEGTDLRTLLEDGPLPAAEAVALGRDIAAGLAEAHRYGIVHRDLKSENVLVTPGGRAKITDFGIAKRLLLGKPEDSLTVMGHVLGTYRAMSPEQARGKEVDARSDLFSLGVLLYEALTGHSPFDAEDQLAILSRILHDRQTPAREANPAVPETLSRLIDHLLEKDPLLRPRNAGEVLRALGESSTAPAQRFTETATEYLGPRAGRARRVSFTTMAQQPRPLIALGLALAIGVLIVVYLVTRPAGEPTYVAVLPPEVAGDTPEIQLLASAVEGALTQTLIGLHGLSVKDLTEAEGLTGSPAALARAMDADEAVLSRLHCRPESCRITLKRIGSGEENVLFSQSFDIPTDDLHLVANAVTVQIRRGYPDHQPRDGSRPLQARHEDLRDLLRLRHKFNRREDPSMESLVAALEDLRVRSPWFLDAYLLEADVLRYRFYDSRDPKDVERAFYLLEQAREIAPGDPQPLLTRIQVAIAANRLDLVEQDIAELRNLIPGDVRLLDGEARLLQARGRTAEALAVLRRAARQHPSVKRLFTLAQMEMTQGNIAEARQTIEQALARAPDHFDTLSLLATLELLNGDVKRATAIYIRLIQRSPDVAEMSNLAFAYFIQRRYADAARLHEQVLEREPGNPLVTLNLADAYLLTGRRAKAEPLYLRVLELLRRDPSASTPQYLTTKAQALAHLGRGREAVAAVQEALRLAPNDGMTAFEASLVFALLNEPSSAIANGERALALGVQKQWFSFPWFNSLRRHPDFQSLMKAPPSSPARSAAGG